jgi:hypothetical protein
MTGWNTFMTLTRRPAWKAAFLWLISGILLLSTASAHAGEVYFMVVFGAERPHKRATHTHSWATFIRAHGEGDNLATYALEWRTISWLPHSLNVRTVCVLPEPGVNLDLHATFDLVLREKLRISQWGPYQIDKTLYERALQQIEYLESGAVRYKAVDVGYSTRRVSNCIHALSDLAQRHGRLRIGSPAWGELASYEITRELRPWIINPCQVHDWLEVPLGLRNYPIVHRTLDRHFRIQRLKQSLSDRRSTCPP